MSKHGSSELIGSISKLTTRFLEVDSSSNVLKDESHFDLRSSHRRSSNAKPIVPRLSAGEFQSDGRFSGHVGHIIKFDVEKEETDAKGPKQTMSFLYSHIKHSRQMVKQNLELKAQSGLFEETLLSGVQSQTDADLSGRFTGEMRQQDSSRLTETRFSGEQQTLKEPLSAFNSQAVIFGDISYISLESIWPWPWLPSSLSSSEYISKSKTPVTFSLQAQLQNFPLMPLHHVLQTFFRSIRLFLKSEKIAQVEELLAYVEKNCTKSYKFLLAKACSVVSISNTIVSSLTILPCFVPNVTGCLTRLEAPLANTGIIPPFVWDLWPAKLDSQLDRAVILIQVVAEFVRLLYSERLSVFYDDSGYPKCNHQFRKLFSSVKIPGTPYDATHCFFKTMYEHPHSKSPKHIIVICRGQLFCLNILLDEFHTLSTVALSKSLQQIQDIAEENVKHKMEEACQGVCILTSMDRDVWSDTRKHLMELSDNNRASLQMLEEAMFILSLDHMNAKGPERIVNEALFADGFNRCYDKGFSFYMYRNGLLTVNVCPSIVDASIVNALLRFIHLRILEDNEKWEDEVYIKSGLASRCVSTDVLNRTHTLSNISGLIINVDIDDSEQEKSRAEITSETENLWALNFDLDSILKKEIQDAKMSFIQLSANISSSMCHFEGFQMNFFQDKKIDVDAVAHLTIHLTFFKMYFRPAAVASKIGIRRFHHAHHDILATTTEQSIAWCRAMLSKDVPASERKKLFYSAVAKHVQILEEVRSGLGCFNHLSALRETVVAKGDDKSVKVLDDLFELPAGSLESMDINCEGLDPLGCLSVPVIVPQTTSSYGVGYAMANAKALFTVCTWKNNPGTCAEMFARSLHRCLKELQDCVISM